jgi:hypothetical protein
VNYTPNLNLKKPAKTDPVLIDDLNDNMDILDHEVKDVRDNFLTTYSWRRGSYWMSEPTLQQEIEARRPATEGTLRQMASV